MFFLLCMLVFVVSGYECPIDVLLILDGSGSITRSQWKEVRKFGQSLATSLSVSETKAHLGVIQFSSEALNYLNLTGNNALVQETLGSLQQLQGGTAIGAALTLAGTSAVSGWRPNVDHVAILMTDGQNNAGPKPVPAATALKQGGLHMQIFGLAVGADADRKTVDAIVSPPVSGHAFNISSFDVLDQVVGALTTRTCVKLDSVTPSSGPAAGGTAVLIAGSGFEDTATLSCMFGSSKPVAATFGSPDQIACVTPAGEPGATVSVEVSLNGIDFTAQQAVNFTYDGGSSGAGCGPNNDCFGHGVCLGKKCVCNAPFTGPWCENMPCPGSPPCSGHGGCTGGTCTCQPGWSGPDCSQSACPGSPPCSDHGKCTAAGCVCSEGYRGPDCSEDVILCCQYCQPVDRNHPTGPFKPGSWLAECYKSFCPGRFPDVLVKSWEIPGKTIDSCIFNNNPMTNRPCIQNYGYCK